MSPCGCGRHRREERSLMSFTAADMSTSGLFARACGQSITGSTLPTSCTRRRIKRDLKPGDAGTLQTRVTRFWADAAISPAPAQLPCTRKLTRVFAGVNALIGATLAVEPALRVDISLPRQRANMFCSPAVGAPGSRRDEGASCAKLRNLICFRLPPTGQIVTTSNLLVD